MIRTSEWVSLGHPDKIADYITSYILDKYLCFDPNVRYALEVMIKNNDVILAGEITSTESFKQNDYEKFVKEALRQIGYDEAYNKKWGDNAIDINKINVQTFISKQSPNIAQGVDNNGWGDQGIYFGYASYDGPEMMPLDYYTAKSLGSYLYNIAKNKHIGGLDIKTQVTMDGEKPCQVIVAMPVIDIDEKEIIEGLIHNWVRLAFPEYKDVEIIFNGTGKYVIHSSIGDSGVTGRKLVVDFYGSGSRVGGGSTWGKDPTKADVALNLYARKLAVDYAGKYADTEFVDHVEVELSTCIGKPCTNVVYKVYGKDTLLEAKQSNETFNVNDVIKELDLRKPIYANLCKNGLFSEIKY